MATAGHFPPPTYKGFISVYTDIVSFFLVFPAIVFAFGIRIPYFVMLLSVFLPTYVFEITKIYHGNITQLVLVGSTVAIVLLVRTKEVEIARRKLFLLMMNLNSHVRDLEIQVEPLSENKLSCLIFNSSFTTKHAF